MVKKIILFSLTFILSLSYQAVSQKVLNKIKLDKTDLQSGYNYSAFTANKNYLAWGEFYTGDISIYNLKTHHLDTLKLKKGKGPHEYVFYTSLALTQDDKLIIADPSNIKLMIYNIGSKSFSKDVKFEHLRPYRLQATKDIIFALNEGVKIQSLYYILNRNNEKEITPVDMGNYNIIKEFSYFFKREGYITANKSFGIFITRYYPTIYVSDLKSKKFLKKIQFDHWVTKKGKSASVNGRKTFMAPEDVDVINKGIAFVPGTMQSIFMLAKGKSTQRNYDLSHLRVYNFMKEKFTGTIDLGINASEIVVNNRHLFVYSKDQNEIYDYTIIPPK